MVVDRFDKMAVVVDWLDACRNQDIEALLDCYAEDAGFDCACESVALSGRARLATYWKTRLDWKTRLGGPGPAAFGLEQILPHADGVLLDYLNFEGKPARVVFNFDASGKIAHMRCEPAR